MTKFIDGYKSQQEPRTPEQRWSAFTFPMLEPCGVRHWRTEHLGYVLTVDGVGYSPIVDWKAFCGDLLIAGGRAGSVDGCRELGNIAVRKHALGGGK